MRKQNQTLQSSMAESKRIAIVTGANKGLGFDVVRQLASEGITVVLTARDNDRGLNAIQKLKDSGGLSGEVIFHQLDVADSLSVASLAEFVKTKFGRLDILVNNAGIIGGEVDGDAVRASMGKINWSAVLTQTYESAVKCFQTNYYGLRSMIEAFLPLLQLSQSPRIANVSSQSGQLEHVRSEWAKGILSDIDRLTEERLDEVLNEYLKDLKEGTLEAKGWPLFLGAYTVSKAAMNAQTRILAKKHPNMKVNSVCPGFVKTDLNFHSGILTVEQGAESIANVALLSEDAPSGSFFIKGNVSTF